MAFKSHITGHLKQLPNLLGDLYKDFPEGLQLLLNSIPVNADPEISSNTV